MRRKFLRAVLLGTYLLIISVILFEGGVRLWGYSERHIYDPIYMPFDKTTEIAYVHKPNLTQARARGLAMINTDSLGLRAQTAGLRYGPKDENEYRIAIAGDSVTFGEGIQNTEDTFSQVVEKTLNRKQTTAKVRVFNYGASAYSVQQMEATLQYRMLDIQPDLVVMAIIPSDFDLTRTPAVDGSGYFVDTRLARLNPPDSAIRRLLRGVRLTYVLRDAVYSWFVPIPDVLRNLADGVLPESYRYIREFKATADKREVPSIIVLLPTARVGPLFDRIATQLHHDEIEFVNLSSLRNEFTLEQFRASRFDGHPSAAVHQRIGQDLAEYILQGRLKTAVQTQVK